MRLVEIFRKTLPLRKGVIANGRGSYGALVVTMPPMDFLRLTTKNQQDIGYIWKATTTSIDDYNKGSDDYDQFTKNRHYMPYLNVNYPSGLITGHEGRHRAAMIAKAGGTVFPMMIFFHTDYQYALSYEMYNRDTEETEDQVEIFDSLEAGKQREDEIKALAKLATTDYDQPHSYYSIRLRTLGGHTLRGHPGRSDFQDWKHAAWKPSDMPPYLIGQFDRSLRIPTSGWKIGVVKGYHHYAKDL